MSTVIPGDRRVHGADNEDSLQDSRSVCVVVSGDETGGRYALVETLVRRGSEPPLHLHTREHELVCVLEGSVTIYGGDEPSRCDPGDCALLSKGSEHTFRVESGESRLLAMLIPAGLDGLYRELGRSIDPLSGDSDATSRAMDRLVAASARYGVEITGPNPLTELGGDTD
jgi:mannose-6-phosphate isomerase-like protein (cupin superfamily)